MIQPELEDAYETSRHLDQAFDYVTKIFRFKLASNSNETHTIEVKIYCVFDWRLSPFVNINPNRIALIGRDVLLELKPKVLLDFEERQTGIVATAKSSPAHKKSSGRKKRAPKSRRRR